MKRPRLTVQINLHDLRHEGSLDIWRGELADVVEGHLQTAVLASLENCLLRHGEKPNGVEHLRD